MLLVSAMAVGIAAAGALGGFDGWSGHQTPDVQVGRAVVSDAGTVATPGAPPFLTVTYVLVSTEEERAVWDNVEETINQRELLSTMALEVLVVTNAEQEAAAYELIDAAREAYPWNEYVIEDLRMQ